MAAGDTRAIAFAPYRAVWQSTNVTNGALNTGDAANMDAEVSIDTGAYTNVTPGAETEIANGDYYVDLTAAEMGGTRIRVVPKTSTANMTQHVIVIITEPCLNSGVAQASSSGTLVLRSTAVATDDYYNGADVEIVRGTGAGQIRRIADYTGSSKTCIMDRSWATTPDTTSVYKVYANSGPGLTAAAGLIFAQSDFRTSGGDVTNHATIGTGINYWSRAQKTGSVNDAGPSTSSFITDLGSATTNFYRYSVLTFISGTLKGKSFFITSYDGLDYSVDVSPTMPVAPSNGDLFTLTGLYA